MAALFTGGKTPKLSPAPAAPGLEDKAVQDEAEIERRRLAGARGRASTIFSDPLGGVDITSNKKRLGN